MSSQNADIPEQSAPAQIGKDNRLKWPPTPEDRPGTKTGSTDVDPPGVVDDDDDNDVPAGSDQKVKECFITFQNLFEQGNSIVAAIPAESRTTRYEDETRVAMFQGVKDSRVEYFKIVLASSVNL